MVGSCMVKDAVVKTNVVRDMYKSGGGGYVVYICVCNSY